MKKLMFAVLATAIMGGIVVYGPQLSKQFNSVTVEQRTVVEEKEVEVDQLQRAVDEALKEAEASIVEKAQAAYDSTFEMESKKIELEVRQKLQAEQDEIITNLEKEVGVY